MARHNEHHQNMGTTSDSSAAAVVASDSYIALCPRGLQHVFFKRLEREVRQHGFSLTMLGGNVTASDKGDEAIRLIGERTSTEGYRYQRHLLELLSKRKKQHSKTIGTVKDPWMKERHVSVGYHHDDQQRVVAAAAMSGDGNANGTNQHSRSNGGGSTVVWSHEGNASQVWVYFATNAPVHIVSQLRFMGPLLAGVQVWENVNLDENQSLEQVETVFREELHLQPTKFNEALKLWHGHVKDNWPLSPQEQNEIADKMMIMMQGHGADSSRNGNAQSSQPLSCRLSCVRSNSKQYSYTREQFLTTVADHILLPKERSWRVNLSNYNVEIVLLVRSKCLAVGLALRPYQHIGAKSFAQGTMPPDVTPPYLSGNVLSGLVRLRPTTAQLLWGLLDNLSPGDVVLDPCAGIGTIPLEVPNGVIGLGGDLILSDNAYRSLVADYVWKMKQHDKRCKSDLLAWDAAMLPLRASCVAVVSDLPFGQQCLSSAKLDMLLPLLFGECARVLRPDGFMVLLCGAYPAVLDTLDMSNALQAEGDVWRLPCDAVFPVNIGGLIAWVVKVKRGPAESICVANHGGRARKLVRKRQQAERHLRKSDAREAAKADVHFKYRRLQK